MIKSLFSTSILAAIHLAAFLLQANGSVIPVFSSGTVETINPKSSGTSAINKVILNNPLEFSNLVATGVSSRCELHQNEITYRLGSLSIAQWIDNNNFFLNSGSAVVCSEKEFSLAISSRDSKAIFSGTGTLILEALENGGFKIIPLEVKGTITTSKGGKMPLIGGRMLLILGNPTYYGDAYDIDLMLLLRSSMLINAFPSALPTFDKIGLAIYVQELKLKGKYDALIGDSPTKGDLEIWRFGNAE